MSPWMQSVIFFFFTTYKIFGWSKSKITQVPLVPMIAFPNRYNFIIVLFQTPSADTESVFHHLVNEVSAFDCHAMFVLIFHLPARKSDATAKF